MEPDDVDKEFELGSEIDGDDAESGAAHVEFRLGATVDDDEDDGAMMDDNQGGLLDDLDAKIEQNNAPKSDMNDKFDGSFTDEQTQERKLDSGTTGSEQKMTHANEQNTRES